MIVSEGISRFNRILGELRRRHVFRLAGLYVVGAWLVLQVSDVLLEIVDAPEGSLRLIAVVLVVGFPLAVIMGWIYDITPRGVVRTGPQDAPDTVTYAWNWRWLDYAVIVGLVAILAFILVRDGEPVSPMPARSIAVLPFIDLSPEGDNRYFGDGLSEALMDSLARIPDLRVTARTSSFVYRDPGIDVREVAAALDVASLLEGSVRKSGSDLKISARLVDGRTGHRLWGATFDATMEDIFSVQETISRGIAEALKIRLLGGEELVPVPTLDQAAYEDYLRGRNQLRLDGTVANMDQAIAYFRRALERDQGFGLASAGLCTAFWEKYNLTKDSELAEQAMNACRQAESEPGAPAEIQVALGGLFRETGELEQSEALLRQVLDAEPNNAEVHAGLGETLRLLGDLEGAARHQRRAIELDPAFWRYHWNLGRVLILKGQLEDAIVQLKRTIRLQPESPAPYYTLGGAYVYQGEHLKAADAFRESIRRNPNPQAYANAGTLYFYSGDYGQAEEMFQQAVALTPSDFRYRGFLADAIRMQQDRGVADSANHFETAVRLAYQQLEINPREHLTRAAVAGYLAQLGKLERASEELDVLEHASGLDMDTKRAMGMAYLFLGQRDLAIKHLAAAVTEGFPLAFLQQDPRLQDLAEMSEFQALLKTDAPVP
jgi:adenylate cyclase